MVAAERYLDTREFAKILGVARVTVIKWIKGSRIVVYSEGMRQEVEKV
jgi:predicted site-specific integrase-resolvase